MLAQIGKWIWSERRAFLVVTGCTAMGAFIGYLVNDVFRETAICGISCLIGICFRRQNLI